MALNPVKVVSGIEKAKLQAVLHNVEFLNISEVDQYKCCNCGQLALYHYVTTCKHVFCGKCHGQFHDKPCPTKNCANKCIDEVSQNVKFERSVYELQALCAFHNKGCEEITSLANYLMHQSRCKFAIKKSSPKEWIPHQGHTFIKKVEDDMTKLKFEANDLRGKTLEIDDKFEKKCDLLENRISTYIEQMEIKCHRMNSKINDINTEFKDKAPNEQIVEDIIENKQKQMTVDITINISEQMFKKIDTKTTDLKNDLLQSIQKSYVSKDELELNINSAFTGKSEELSTKLGKSIALKTQELENSFKKNSENLRRMQEIYLKRIDLKFEENSINLEKSGESFAKSLNAVLDEKTKALKISVANDVSVAWQELKSKIEKNAEINTKRVENHSSMLKELKEKIEQESKNLKNWVNEIANYTTQIHWRINNWRKAQEKKKDISSDVFQTRDYGLKMRGRIMFKDGYIYPWIEFINNSSLLKSPTFVYKHRRRFVISIWKGEEEAKKLEIVQEPGFAPDYNAKKWMTECLKLEWSRFKFFNADFIDVRIIIEPLDILYKVNHSKDGVLTWKLENYNHKKRNGIDYEHCIWSEYFYDDLGCRFKVGLTFRNKHIELHLHNLDIELPANNSDKLRDYNITTMVLDQSGSEKNIVLTKAGKYSEHISDFCFGKLAYVDFETLTFLKDDSIIIKVMLEDYV